MVQVFKLSPARTQEEMVRQIRFSRLRFSVAGLGQIIKENVPNALLRV